ncbi:kinesin-like protein KIF23 [Diaphorina citri]|uniref:Kinesin-like protein KIF23 n=1 Tax=Diaphorina citri TaxID=121845 RepID=A0A3Q0IW82_DIACI|nr:kinesin-like protein KIF23 [Diaphorina citri]
MASAKTGKTPRKVAFSQNNGSSDPLQVFCRIRPMDNSYDESCISVVSDTTVQLTPPDGSNPRYFNNKEVQYVFKKIFNVDVGQKQVYSEVAHPLVANLIHAKNGLLLTYGVTGSGKTYTMNGTNSDGGIMMRCIDVLFNSIGRYQPRKRTFRPDKLNGFEVQSQVDILLQEQAEMNGELTKRTPGPGLKRNKSDPEMEPRIKDASKVEDIEEDNVYSVFVSYIEIYNNSVHDLLEDMPEGNNARIQLNNRLIREDGDKNMFVHGVNEIEVTTPDEAFQVSHPEIGGNINNSLMTLRTCLEILRENQLQGTNKIPPFRESKLTHLFKSYFTGDGDVRMIVCVNPRVEDYDENLAVMKFAEMSQEVQISKALPSRLDFGLTPGRRKFNEASKKMREILNNEKKMESLASAMPLIDSGVLYSLPPFPSFDARTLTDDFRQKDLLLYLETRRKKELELCADIRSKVDNFRRGLMDLENTARAATAERDTCKAKLEAAHQKVLEADNRAASLSMKLEMELRSRDALEKDLERKDVHVAIEYLLRKDVHVERLRMMKERQEEKTKATKSKLSQKFQSKMQAQAETYESKLRHNEKKVIRKVKNLIDSQLPDTSSLSSCSSGSAPPIPTPRTITSDYNTRTTRSGKAGDVQSTPNVTARRNAPAPPRSTRRRSRSAGPPTNPAGTWLHHTPGQVLLNTPHGTVFQPTGWKKRKSVTALTDVKDIVDPKLAKYSLMTQEPNTDGEMETHLFKGDVLPTVGGGAQVVFNELETLRQTSPLSSPVKHRIAAFNARSTEDIENRCQMGIEGHSNRMPKK